MNYYNEFDPFAASWLRQLIADGLIPQGEVDERSIIDVDPSDLKGFTQCHFFAGIGGWSYALELAGWSADRPVWTGSPPCQPFSVAGNKKGQEDERHLWPHFFNLIRECSPPTVFGEQVAAAIRTGWFDDLQADMENEGYATAMAVLPACGIGAPHKRERLFFVADSIGQRHDRINPLLHGNESRRVTEDSTQVAGSSKAGTLADSNNPGLQRHRRSEQVECEEGRQEQIGHSAEGSSTDTLAKSDKLNRWSEQKSKQSERGEWWQSYGYSSVPCADGKYRPIPTEPALFPLANGIPNRVGLLRGAGNAIVPQVAAEIIKAYMEY